MPQQTRWYLPDVIYEITSRTIQERYLLRPSAESRALILGVIARAQLLYQTVKIYALVFLSNHYHLMASADDGEELAMFLGYVNGNIAREMGRIHDWRGPFWGRRARPIPILDEKASVERLRYILLNGVKEGLVASPRHWPGATSIHALLDGSMTIPGTWIDRDDLRRARAKDPHADATPFTSELEVELSPLPCWEKLDDDALSAKYAELVADVEREAAGRTTPVLGAKNVMAQDPHARPEEPERGRAPLCHTTCPERLQAFRAAYTAFVNAFRSVSRQAKELLTASSTLVFPPGSFPRPRWFRKAPSTMRLDDLLAHGCPDIGWGTPAYGATERIGGST